MSNVIWKKGELEKLPIKDASVDVAMLSQALHHAHDPARAVAEAARVTAPGGRVLLLDLRAHDEEWVRAKLGDRRLGFADDELRRMLTAAGLRDVKVGVGARKAGDPFTVLIASGTKGDASAQTHEDTHEATQPMTPDVRAQLDALLAKRILVLDGAMGTMIQRHKLTEADFRGERFGDHPKDLRGNNDLLVLTRPDVIAEIHRQYLEAGSDIIETNTFSSTAIAQARLRARAARLRAEPRRRAGWRGRRATSGPRRTPSRPRFVAGSMGPTNRILSISPDVNNPAFRNMTFDAAARRLQGAGARPDRRRLRPAAGRDDRRHAERQGRRSSRSRSSSRNGERRSANGCR